MAERRMFAKSIVLSDAFLDMPMSARCLYFTLGMLADDDGFIGNPKSIMRQCGASQDDMVVLLQKRFVLSFDNGVIVIKHWRMNNYLRNDRHTGTTYLEEMSSLAIDDKGAYTEKEKVGIPVANQAVYPGKVSIGKDSIDKDIYSVDEVESSDNRLTLDESSCSLSNSIKEIIDYLNLKTDSKYTCKNKSCNSKINARLDEGHTVEDFKKVIDIKVAEWQGSDMEKYLRPETLFGNKFEGYLNQKEVKNGNTTRNTTSYEDEVKEYERKYEEYWSQFKS